MSDTQEATQPQGSTYEENGPFSCDIETMFDPSSDAEPEITPTRKKHPGDFSFSPPKGWTDEEKIEKRRQESLAKHEKAVEEWELQAEQNEEAQIRAFKEKAALSPMTGRILAIGYLKPKPGKPLKPFIDLARLPVYEERVITRFFQELCGKNYKDRNRCYGHNFLQFDLPFIVTRARLLQLPVLDRIQADLLSYSSYLENLVIDTLQHWRGKAARYNPQLFPKGTTKLEYLAKRMGVRSTFRDTECSGAEFADHLFSDDPEKQGMALDHLTADLVETYNVAKGMRL